MQEAAIGGLAPWYGSKRTMARDICVELGRHDQFFDPAVASFAVILAKDVCRSETVNDLHGDVINLARVVQDPERVSRLYRRLRRTLFHESMQEEARQIIVELPEPPEVTDEERAYWFFLFSWMGRNGEVGLDPAERSSRICVRWTPNGGSPAVRFESAIKSLVPWHRRLRRVTILRRDMFEVIDAIPDRAGTVVYIDPPYWDKSEQYLHDFAKGLGHAFKPGLFPSECAICGRPEADHRDDHKRMRDAVARFKETRVVISYYDCPPIRELYEGWTFVDHSRHKNLSVQGRHGSKPKTAPEALIINGPSLAS